MTDVLDVKPEAEPTPSSFITPEAAALAEIDPQEDTEGAVQAKLLASQKLVEQMQPDSVKRPTSKGLKGLVESYWAKKKWTVPLTVVAVLLLLLAIPLTRYDMLGLFIQRPFSVKVIDNVTHRPVSSAIVTAGGRSFKTDALGMVSLHLKVGKEQFHVGKNYYDGVTTAVFIGLSQPNAPFQFLITATGRQVPLKVVNKITGLPVNGADIKLLNTEAKTDKNGAATIVLPTTSSTIKAAIQGDGYNNVSANVTVTDQIIPANTISVTPTGTLYFLSKRTGTINVMKSDLDGSNVSVVLAGTGTEEDNNTVLLASQDWKYLALQSRRVSTDKPASLYLIDTTHSDKLTTIDEGNISVTLSGWSGHAFIYTLFRNSVQVWQPNRQSLKSYNAETAQLVTLDSTDAAGTSPYNYQFESLNNVAILSNAVAYTKVWQQSYGYGSLSGRLNTINTISPNAQNKKVLKELDATTVSFVSQTISGPNSVYFTASPSDGTASQYYELDKGVLKDASASDVATVNGQYITYLSSPSNNQTFWYEPRDGKNSLFVGDANGANKKEIGTLTDYVSYGWYGENYLLVSKNNSELFIFGTDGLGNGVQPFKLTDYHKPSADFTGYGKGYGGF